MQSRRAFLGSTAALGLVGAAGTALDVHAQDHRHATDAVVTELRRQMIASVKGLKPGRGGEPARRISGILALTAAAGITADFDTRLRAAVRRHGRDGLLLQTPDPKKLEAELKAYGITEPLLLKPVTLAERRRVLDTVLARGIAPLLEAIGRRFDTLSVDLDRRMVLPVQTTPEDRCWEPCSEIQAAEVMMMLACLGAAFDFGMSCFFLTGLVVGLRVGYSMRGCLC
jgi:hypothetical protein